MPYDVAIGERVRAVLDEEEFETKKMFGGLAFMLNGHMCCGVIDDRVVLRLGHEGGASALEGPQVTEMDFTGKPIRTMVHLSGDVSDDVLEEWVAEAVAFTKSLPPKIKKEK
jgi:hypothetical protein